MSQEKGVNRVLKAVHKKFNKIMCIHDKMIHLDWSTRPLMMIILFDDLLFLTDDDTDWLNVYYLGLNISVLISLIAIVL